MSPAERPGRQTVTVAHAVGLGLLHGPTELLPVSSSAHTTVVPWLLGWPYGELEPERRKSFEVALHAGTAAAIVLLTPSARRRRSFDRRTFAMVAVGSLPAGLAGYRFETAIEERLGTPLTIASGLLAGSVALVAADRAPEGRHVEDARLADALWIGLAQVGALMPGVSRHGATLAAARMRGFTPGAAQHLSELLALPPIAGASVLRLLRLLRHGRRFDRLAAVGAVGAFVSTAGAAPLVRPLQRRGSLWPFALYRTGLAAVILIKSGAGRAAAKSRRAPIRPGSTARHRPWARA